MRGLTRRERLSDAQQRLHVVTARADDPHLLTVPAWLAPELKPGHPGKWAMTVTPNFRLTFRVDLERQEVSDLLIEDYH